MLLRKMDIKLGSKDIEDKIPDITNLATNATLNAKINKVNKGNTYYFKLSY